MSRASRHAAALFSALRFSDPNPEPLLRLSNAEWEHLLPYADKARLTLLLGHFCHAHLPGWVQERVRRNLEDSTECMKRVHRAYGEIAEALQKAGAEHVVLKGFSQWPDFVPDLHLRPQADIDLYCPHESISRANAALLEIGYRPIPTPERLGCDHLPTLIRPDARRRRSGNAFDPEITPGVELHYQFWSRPYVRTGPTDLQDLWNRRVWQSLSGICFPALHPIDRFTYSALHALRHLLFGGLLPSHIYEIGYFLHHNAENQSFWKVWRDWHNDSLRAIAVVPSLLAVEWFGCRLPDLVEEEVQRLPESVPRWFQKFSDSLPAGLFQPNKDALWLHLSLLGSPREKSSVLVRRLFPLWLPPLNSRWVQEKSGDRDGNGQKRLWQKCASYLSWFVIRTIRHLRILPSTLWHGLRLWSS
jgi:hypothetical protein